MGTKTLENLYYKIAEQIEKVNLRIASLQETREELNKKIAEKERAKSAAYARAEKWLTKYESKSAQYDIAIAKMAARLDKIGVSLDKLQEKKQEYMRKAAEIEEWVKGGGKPGAKRGRKPGSGSGPFKQAGRKGSGPETYGWYGGGF